jgi:Flp pilus assembly pilin Flp
VEFTQVVAQHRRLDVEKGQTLAEYAVVLALITALVTGAIAALSGGIQGAITTVVGLV